MSMKEGNTPFERRVEECAAQILLCRIGLLEGVTEGQILSDYCPSPSPRFWLAVRAKLRDLECRTYLTCIDHLAWARVRMRRGGYNAMGFIFERQELLKHSLRSVAGALREERRNRRNEELRDARIDNRANQSNSNLDWMSWNPDASLRKAREDPGRIRIYKDPGSADRDDRGRSVIRKKLAKEYTLKHRMTRHEIDELWSEVHAGAPWMSDVTTWLWEQHLLRLDAAIPHLGFPPMLLVGPPGSGKTHLAHLIGKIAGIWSSRIDLSSRSAAFDLTGVEYAWRSSSPGLPVRTLSEIDHANPLIVLDEIDKAGTSSNGGDPIEALLPLLQPEMSRNFQCPFIQGTVDLSWINWIATANDLSRVPDPILDRVKIFRVEAPRGSGLRQLVGDRLGPVSADDVIIDAVCARIESEQMSLRGLGRLAEEFRAIQKRPILH